MADIDLSSEDFSVGPRTDSCAQQAQRQRLAECVLKLTEPVSSLRYQSATAEFQQGKQK
jgi:hypothetical protein